MSSLSMIYSANGLMPIRSHDSSLLLKSFTVSINQGEWITIVGHNGSGKSTLAAFISGLQRSGIQWSGEEQRCAETVFPIITQMTSEYLLGATAYEDMVISYEQYGKPMNRDILETQIDELLAALELFPLKHVPIEQLSGGERQLVAIAGALLMESPCLIVDEITSMLSEENKWRVLSIIRKAAKQRNIAVLWITQQLDELEAEDTVWVLQELEVVYQGKASSLYGCSAIMGADDLTSSNAAQLGLPIPWSVKKCCELQLPANKLQFNPYGLARVVKQSHGITV